MLKRTYSRLVGQKRLLLTLYEEDCINAVWQYHDSIELKNLSESVENLKQQFFLDRLQAIKEKETNIETQGDANELIQEQLLQGNAVRDKIEKKQRNRTEYKREIGIELAKAEQAMFENIGLIQSILNYPCELDGFQQRLESSIFILDIPKDMPKTDEDLSEWFNTQMKRALFHVPTNIRPIINELLKFLAKRINEEERNFAVAKGSKEEKHRKIL